MSARHLSVLALLAFACSLHTVGAVGKSNRGSVYGMDIVSMGNCSEFQNLSNCVKNVKITKLSRVVVALDMDIVVTHIPNNLRAVIEFFKCADRDGSECEHFMRIPLSKICDLLEAKNQYWTPFLESIHPKMKCPRIATGTYKVINATIDIEKLMDTVNYMPDITNYFWKQYLSFASAKRTYFCYSCVSKIYKLKRVHQFDLH